MSRAKTVVRLYPEAIADRVFAVVEGVLSQFNQRNTPGVMAVRFLEALTGVPDMGQTVSDEEKKVVPFKPKPMDAIITANTWTSAMKLAPIKTAMALAEGNGYQLHFHWTLGMDWKHTPFERMQKVADAKENPLKVDDLLGESQLEILDIFFRPLAVSSDGVTLESVTIIDIFVE